MSVLDRVAPGSRVAIIRLRSLGDCVLTTPAIALLKQHRNDLKIAVAVEDRFAAVYSCNPDVDAVLTAHSSAIYRWNPALTINLHGGTRSVKLTLASRARWRASFAHLPFSAIYNVKIPRAQQILGVERVVHTAEHVASAMFYLGVPRSEIPRAKLFVTHCPPRHRDYAIFHPIASTPEKTWPAAHFRAVAEYLQKNEEMEPIFIAAPAESLEEFEGFRRVNGASLDEIKSLMSGASLFVGNDSGPAHMAAAFGIPVIALFGPSDPQVWAPWRTRFEVFSSPSDIAAIGPERVISVLARLRDGTFA